MFEERILFPSIRDGADIDLEGIVSIPNSPPRSGIVLCHPHPAGGGNMNVPLFLCLLSSLIPLGVAVMRFNFGGVGKSGGYFTDGKEEVLDVKAAVNRLRYYTGLDSEKIMLAGWSFGSLMALFASVETVSAPLTIAISPPVAVIDYDDLSRRLSSAPGIRFYVVGERDDLCPIDTLFEFTEKVSAIDRKNVYLIGGADHFLFGWEADVAAFVIEIMGRHGFIEKTQDHA